MKTPEMVCKDALQEALENYARDLERFVAEATRILTEAATTLAPLIADTVRAFEKRFGTSMDLAETVATKCPTAAWLIWLCAQKSAARGRRTCAAR